MNIAPAAAATPKEEQLSHTQPSSTMKPTIFRATRQAALGAALLAASLCATGAAYAQTYQFIDLGTGSANGINNLGEVVGQSGMGATLWKGGSELGLVGGLGGSAAAINNLGQIVGQTVTNGVNSPAMWNGGVLITLNGPIGSYATGINDAGQIVGGGGNTLFWNHSVNATQLVSSTGLGYGALGINASGTIVGASANDNTQSVIATVWKGSNSTLLPYLGSDGYAFAQAFAVNNAGVVVGSSNDGPRSGNAFAMEWNGSTATELGNLGGANSYAEAINNAGLIVGSSSTANGYQEATMWKGTTAINLNTLLSPTVAAEGWTLQDATGVNDKGWIVGDAYNSKTGAYDAFMLEVSPVPEADTWAMLLAGITLVGMIAHFKPTKATDKSSPIEQS